MNDRYSRQSFLGPDSQDLIGNVTIGIPGLGGGGSHIVQQLAHVGFKRFVLYDWDTVEASNLNRLVGATSVDLMAGTPKLHLAKRMVYGLQPDAMVEAYSCRWQENPVALRRCQIVLGCVDSYKGREELEIACRRHLAHYIDIGMDVHGERDPVIGGQVILSSPGGPCMRCMGFLTEDVLGREGAKYGAAGPRPQVIWPNGVLASTAVGLAVDLVTGWTRNKRTHAFLVYDGNEGTLAPSFTLRNLPKDGCPHFPSGEVGDPIFRPL
ncbi:HesA/MoeB/ThiF family protein [Holophaga foetida]|uniref:HesA/MoeB/ThiF family protein n=1 Tax=Holophaga foetida TaxID=35839 RepID=UPI00024742A7|nr:ThiF family adenylyltransferase [Holophaga foetida]